ncbi:MAG: NUDIX domain-containing protein [Patescibacteria group bacterium]
MPSKIIIVDENDNPIGVKERDDKDLKIIYRVAALWLTNSKGEFLLARRAYNKSHNPGQWGPAVAGTVEEGETYESNIIKEAKEELGLDLKLSDLKIGPKIHVKTKWNHFTQFYIVNLDLDIKDIKFEPKEVAEVRWFSPADLKRELITHPEEFLASLQEDNFYQMFYDSN